MVVDERSIRQRLHEEYRIACPRDHTDHSPSKTTPTAYCRTCGKAYTFGVLLDRRRVRPSTLSDRD